MGTHGTNAATSGEPSITPPTPAVDGYAPRWRVGVVGATGYVGAELISWISQHPNFDLVGATTTSQPGVTLGSLYPSALGTAADVTLVEMDSLLGASPELVFLAVPHTSAMALVPDLLDRGITVVDMSADFRLTDPLAYPTWYKVDHTAPELLGRAVYGLPELTRGALHGASLIACAGCYPTATALAAAPALATFGASGAVIVDAKSGVSGAGRGLSQATHYCATDESVSAYKVGLHQHTPEMEQTLTLVAGAPVSVLFTPHLIPMKRGLLSTVYIQPNNQPVSAATGESSAHVLTAESVYAAYAHRYADEPFVTVLPYGQFPSTSSCTNTNGAQVGVRFDERTGTIVAACAIDNLGKGAASQGIQVANAVLGLPETTGLTTKGGVV